MLRSLFAGVTGLGANIVELDVIGNNIANSNTIGFKSARVTFQEILTQNLRSATRPSEDGTLGGVNPQQIGLGTVVGSIDSHFAQGNLRTTGNKLDLAIQGSGFFVLSDGQSTSYTRAGNFAVDANNNLVNAATGLKVQGLMADELGNFTSGAVGDIVIDPTVVRPAQATSEVQLWGNLNSASEATGTHLLQQGPMLAVAQGTDDIRALHTSNLGADLLISDGDEIALSGLVGGVDISNARFIVGDPASGADGTTLEDLRSWFQTRLIMAGADPTTSVTIGADGRFNVTNGAGGPLLEDIRLEAGGRVAFNQMMSFGDSIAPGGSVQSNASFLRPATEADALSDLYNSQGDALSLDFQDDGTGAMVTEISISGTLGNSAVTPLVFSAEQGVTTLGELLTRMNQTFGLSNADGATLTTDGRIDVQGDAGLVNEISNITIRELNNDTATNLESSIDFRVITAAQDAVPHRVTTTVYDSLGDTHNLTFTFTKRTGENVWDWVASLDGTEQITAGETGSVSFDSDGRLQSFTYTDGGGSLQFTPQAVGDVGADPVSISINPGTIGDLKGSLTQFAQSDQIKATSDGFKAGHLVDFDIGNDGVISGRFSNDVVIDIARISLAHFANPGGLMRGGNNTYYETGNSGSAQLGLAGEGIMGDLSAGALEASNVDLSEQFTRLVIAQRSFQSNARVISTSDDVLQELVNIV